MCARELHSPSSMTTTPQFLVLTPGESHQVLERNHIGRLAFIEAGTTNIEPLGYVAQGDWLFLRSAYGAKLEALTRDPYVSFEVDEIEGPFAWRSVVVHGTIYLLPRDGGPMERREFQRAVNALRTVMPNALKSGDPVPEREIVYGLHISRLEGRMAQGAPGEDTFRKPALPHSVRRSPRRTDGT